MFSHWRLEPVYNGTKRKSKQITVDKPHVTNQGCYKPRESKWTKSLFAWRSKFLQAYSEDSDQAARMRRLNWVFDGRAFQNARFLKYLWLVVCLFPSITGQKLIVDHLYWRSINKNPCGHKRDPSTILITTNLDQHAQRAQCDQICPFCHQVLYYPGFLMTKRNGLDQTVKMHRLVWK